MGLNIEYTFAETLNASSISVTHSPNNTFSFRIVEKVKTKRGSRRYTAMVCLSKEIVLRLMKELQRGIDAQ